MTDDELLDTKLEILRNGWAIEMATCAGSKLEQLRARQRHLFEEIREEDKRRKPGLFRRLVLQQRRSTAESKEGRPPRSS